MSASSAVVLTHTSLDRDLANECVGNTGIAVLQSQAETKLEAIGDIAAAFPKQEVAWFSPELAFAPSDLLERVALHHRSAGNHYTRTTGLPELAGCEIANAELLAAVGSLEYQAGAPDPSVAFAEVIKMRNDAPPSEKILAAPFDVAEHYNNTVKCSEIAVVTRHDVDRARRCLVDLPANYTCEAMMRWASEHVPVYLPPFSEARCAEAMPRILYVENFSGYSGSEECLRGLAGGLSALGFCQSALIGLDGLLAVRMRESGVSVACPNWDVNRDADYSFDLASYVIRTTRPDLIHCNSPPGHALLQQAHSLGIPITTHMRMISFALWVELLAQSARVIAVSEYVKRKLEAFGVPSEQIKVVYDGVDAEHFHPHISDKRAARAQFEIPQNAFLVLMIARLSASKRHDLLIDAAADAIKSIPSLLLAFVGSYGDLLLRRQIANHAYSRGLDKKIIWLPFQEDIRKIEAAADVLVLCSENEPLGTCILEAMSLEKPVIVSDSGGICEVVEGGVSGVVVPSGNDEALARALIGLAKQPEWAATLGRAARVRIQSGFTLKHHCEQIAEIFRTVCLKR
ncbi:MAG TPA: glycosyltransferase family 4 protein [Bryobacteraceae bacterium]|nr:glycosyltransferase family 4 protein [Bryobacteraceae bacterium]